MKLRTIRKEGGTRVVSVTDILPQDWLAVEITVKKKTKNNKITVEIEKVK